MKNTSVDDRENRNSVPDDDELSFIKRPGDERQTDGEDAKVGLKNSAYKSKDYIFEGKGIQKTAPPKVKDSVLMHTELKSKKGIRESKNIENAPEDSEDVPDQSTKQEKNNSKKNDIHWI